MSSPSFFFCCSCGTVFEEVESDIEEWWNANDDDDDDDENKGRSLDAAKFSKWLCIEKKKYCCPEGHYGPKCKVRRGATGLKLQSG